MDSPVYWHSWLSGSLLLSNCFKFWLNLTWDCFQKMCHGSRLWSHYCGWQFKLPTSFNNDFLTSNSFAKHNMWIQPLLLYSISFDFSWMINFQPWTRTGYPFFLPNSQSSGRTFSNAFKAPALMLSMHL